MAKQTSLADLFQPRDRPSDVRLPAAAHKILAAPNVSADFFGPLIDWIGHPVNNKMSRTQQKEVAAKPPKLAVALSDMIFIQNFTGEKNEMSGPSPNMTQIDFNKGRRDVEGSPKVTALTFDRTGEALAAGSTDHLVSIFNVERGCRIRNLNCHSEQISDISWCRSLSQPYIVATGSFDSTIVIHDIR